MAAYAIFFSYTPQAWARMMVKAEDRAAAARAMIESARHPRVPVLHARRP
jgi:uncharacterized protein with GYD domain